VGSKGRVVRSKRSGGRGSRVGVVACAATAASTTASTRTTKSAAADTSTADTAAAAEPITNICATKRCVGCCFGWGRMMRSRQATAGCWVPNSQPESEANDTNAKARWRQHRRHCRRMHRRMGCAREVTAVCTRIGTNDPAATAAATADATRTGRPTRGGSAEGRVRPLDAATTDTTAAGAAAVGRTWRMGSCVIRRWWCRLSVVVDRRTGIAQVCRRQDLGLTHLRLHGLRVRLMQSIGGVHRRLW